jgi:uncharacterized protein
MNILIAGSSGFIGTALVQRLTGTDHTVTRLVRGATHPPNGETRVTEVSWDPVAGSVDREALDRVGPFDGVVNLAGAGIGDRRWSPSRKQVILDSRVSATSTLVEALAHLHATPPVLVNASAVGYYGDRGDEELTESSTSGTGFLAAVCRAWEGATAPASERGIRTVLLRTGFVLSRHGGALGRQLPLFRIGLGGRLGSGSQYRSWITLDDEVGVILHCLENQVEGAVNATTPVPVTDGQLARAIAGALHRPGVLAVPAAALRLALGSEMATELLLGGQRVLPAVLTTQGYTFAHTEIDGAVRSILDPG